MPNHRITMLLQQSKAGWSESFYVEASDAPAAMALVKPLGLKRRRLLATDALIIGYRTQEVTRTGEVLVETVEEPAILGTNKDPVYNSLLMSCITAGNLKRQYYLRGIPDNNSGLGRFSPSPTYATDLAQYVGVLKNGNYRVRRVNRANLPLPIAGISAGGLVTFVSPNALDVGMTIQFLNTRDSVRRAVQGKYIILSKPTATTATIRGWEAGRVVTEGLYRKVEFIYPQITDVTHSNQIVSRKVGRPFGAPRGRRSARR